MAAFGPELREALAKAIADLNAQYAELNGESARAAAILAVAMLDNELSNVIRHHFREDLDKDIWDRIFGPGAPMGDFKNKTNFIEAIGHFGKQTRITLERIATIRNKFAHLADVRTFTDHRVLQHCATLGKNPVFPYQLRSDAAESDVRSNLLTTVQKLHERLEQVTSHIRELDPPLTPLP